LNDRQRKILALIESDQEISAPILASTIGTTSRTIQRDLKFMQNLGIITNDSPDRGGTWKIL